MPSSLRANVISWAQSVEYNASGKRVIWMDPSLCGGDEGSRRECRRITVTFGTLVATERKRMEREFKDKLAEMPMVTPFEGIICRTEASAHGGFQVVFMRDTHPEITAMYKDVDPETGQVTGSAVFSRKDAYLRQRTGQGYEVPTNQTPPNEIDLWGELPEELRNDPNDIPLDQDPFAVG